MSNLRVLIVEDSESDHQLILCALCKGGYQEVTDEQVETADAMRSALSRDNWDVIIADYAMGDFSGPKALGILQETGKDIPFILVSDPVPQHVAVEMMQAGAQDFIFKQDLERLVPVVARELRQAEIRSGQERTEEALRRSEQNFRALFDYVPAAVFAYDRDGMILYANAECAELFELPVDRLIAHSMFETVARAKDRKEIEERIAYIFSGGSVRNIEWLDVRPNGKEVYMLTNITPVYGPDGTVRMGLSLNIDITERKLTEQKQKELDEHKREFYRRTILAATEGKLEICDRSQIQALAGPPIATWKIECPEDTAAVRHAITDIAEANGMEDSQVYNLAVSAGEAMTNAVKHAHGAEVSLHRVENGLLLVISDQGTGIEALNLPDVALTKGYSTAGTLGMGYKTMMSLADRVYLATGPSGTTVAIQMSLTPTKPISPWNLEELAIPST